MSSQDLETDDEVSLTPAPFYIHETFRRFCTDDDECDFCEFASEDVADPDNEGVSGICPDNLWWYVTQRQKVIRELDASHPPVCPNCGKRMIADRTITLMDKDVAAFTCKHCKQFERDSRFIIESERFRRENNR